MAAFADITTTGVGVQTTIGTPEVIFASDAAIVLPEGGLFVRACSGLGGSFAVIKGQNTGECYLVSRAGVITASQGATAGNYCVAIMILGSQVLAVWVSSTTQYKSRLFSNVLVPAGAATAHSIPAQFLNTSQGFEGLDSSGVPLWTDARRTITVKGLPLVYPSTVGGYWIGQGGGQLPAQICGVTPNGRYFTLYQGDAYEPHIVQGPGSTLYAATRTATNGAQFFTITPSTIPTFVGSLTGGSSGAGSALGQLGDANLNPPVRQPVTDARTGGLMDPTWQHWSQHVSEVAATALVTAQNATAQPGTVTPAPGLPSGSGGSGVQLTGDVLGGPSPSPVATTIATNIVSNTKLRQSVGVSIVGRSANSTGNVADIVAASNGQVLKRSSNALSFAAVDLAADVTGRLPYANVTASVAASSLLGRGSASGAGNWQDVTLDTDLAMTGTVLSTQAGLYRAIVPIVNADIKKLPSVSYLLRAAPASGYRVNVHRASVVKKSGGGAYTGIDATYATLVIQTTGGAWLTNTIANDSGLTIPVTRLTDFLGGANEKLGQFAGPYFEALQSGGGAGDWGYIQPSVGSALSDYDAAAIYLALDNNGSATDLGGGHAANTLTVTLFYTLDAV